MRGEVSFGSHGLGICGDLANAGLGGSGELLSIARLARGLTGLLGSDRDARVGLWDAVSDLDRIWFGGSS